ncbi:class I SAM-dependent methyltransferase [Brucella anthropi]|uniref:class I SAM-dependent methyltransferase n=1 Tax=Brucella anthropi TaxID=529 RepID=UPI001CFCF27B|nr:class I SAM-dependent methyltransferase [Brucella anthropi]
MSRFEAAIVNTISGNDAVNEFHRQYALSSNARGEALISKIINEFTGPLQGKRTLDIGSGWGGVCIAAALQGAEAVGIELVADRVFVSKENLADYPGTNVTFHSHSALDSDFMRSLGSFDLITCDNVIEHVDSDESLISNISAQMNDNAVCYITAPNAFSAGQVLAECHYKTFGTSLLDREDAFVHFKSISVGGYQDYEVTDYFHYEHYISIFERYGLSCIQLVPINPSQETIEAIRADIDRIASQIEITRISSSPLSEKLSIILERYVDRFYVAYNHLSRSLHPRDWHSCASHIVRAYGIELWYFVGRKNPQLIN